MKFIKNLIKDFFENFIANSLVLIVGLCIVFVSVLLVGNCFGGQARQHIFKSFQSNTVGLEREISVYDYTGKQIKFWRCKTTINTKHGDIDFIADGKRNIIRGGIVIIKEVE